jgi:hypothetical protein
VAVQTPPAERAAGRRKLASKGNALPDGSFPIPNVSYLKKAIRAVGRAGPGKRPALARLIRKRGRELGAWSTVRGSWADNSQGATAMANAYMAALREFAVDVSSVSGPRVTKLAGGDTDDQGGSAYQRLYAKFKKRGFSDDRAQMLAQNAITKMSKRKDTAPASMAPVSMANAMDAPFNPGAPAVGAPPLSRGGKPGMDVAFKPGALSASAPPGAKGAAGLKGGQPTSRQSTAGLSVAKALANPRIVHQHIVAAHQISSEEVSEPIAQHLAFHDAVKNQELTGSHRISSGGKLAHDYSQGSSPKMKQTPLDSPTRGRD